MISLLERSSGWPQWSFDIGFRGRGPLCFSSTFSSIYYALVISRPWLRQRGHFRCITIFCFTFINSVLLLISYIIFFLVSYVLKHKLEAGNTWHPVFLSPGDNCLVQCWPFPKKHFLNNLYTSATMYHYPYFCLEE